MKARCFSAISERIAERRTFFIGDIVRERTAGTGLSRRDRERAPFGSTRSRSPEVPSMTNTAASSAAFAAAPLPAAPTAPATTDALVHAARIILPHLERGQRVDAPTLRAAMESAFGGSDAEGAWDWKTAYDACEAATVLFLRKFGPAMRARGGIARRHAADAGQDRGPSPHPYAPLRGEPGAPAILDADRARPRGQRRRRDHAGRPRAGALGRHRLARHPRRARRRRRSCSTSWPRRAPGCSTISFPVSPSPASTRRRSTIISTPASRRASC